MRCRVAAGAALALALGAASGVPAQEPTLSQQLKEAWKAQWQGSPAAARTLFEQALVRARDAHQAVQESEALRGIAATCTALGDYASARARLDEALPIAQAADRAETGRVLNGMGSVAWYHDRNQARAYWERALAELEAAGAVKDAANTIANIVLLLPDQEMDAWLERGLGLAEQAGDLYLWARLLQARGDHLRNRLDFAGSRAALLEAQQLFEEVGRKDAQVTCLNSLGFLYRLHGRPDQALEYQERALALAREIGSPFATMQSLAGVTKALMGLHRTAEATKALEEALALAEASHLTGWIENLQDMMASLEITRGRPERAVAILSGLPLEGPHGDVVYAPRHALLSDALRQAGRVPEALGHAEAAVAGARHPDASEYTDWALLERALCLDALGRPQEALRDGREAVARIEAQRERLLPEDSLRRGFGESQQTYTFMVGLLERLGYHEEALEVATKARARAFLDRLAWRAGLEGSAVGTEPRAVPAATVADVRATARRLGSIVLVYFVAPQASYVWAVGADGPMASAKVPLSADRLARLVDGDVPAASRVATRGAAPLTLPTRAGGLLVLGDEGARWTQLYDALLRPVQASLPRKPGARLTVIPDGPLLRLPFAALRDGSGRYLIERYAIHYAPAVATFTLTGRSHHDASEELRHVLLVGDPAAYPDPGDGTSLAPLPGSRRELDGIARLLGAEHVERLSGQAATEARLRERVHGIDVLHFSTHGVERDDAPLASFVALSPGAGGEGDDGRLTTADVYGLELSADLVFLSACRTARGGVSADGVMGLTRAFFHAGASSIVASLSDVVDEPAQRLVADFYRARLAGEDKVNALRQAQLAMLRALRAGRITVNTPGGPVALPENPALWAPFVLLGEP